MEFDRLRGIAPLLGLIVRLVRCRIPVVTLEDRLANLPLRDAPVRAPVDIHWSAQAIPFILADSEGDLATALGIVHAHLRLVQMEFMRRLALGRVSEVLGSLTLDVDIALRTIDLARAVPAMEAALPPATRAWAVAYLAGINHVISHAPQLPPEFRLFALEREPWTLADLLAVGRLAAADITWGHSVKLLRMRAAMHPDTWSALWPDLVTNSLPPPRGPMAAFARGSNSAAVGARRTATGKAMIASDPHVSVQLPSLWMACGMKAPGFHAAGLTLPGLPSIAIGRNASIAWGATNLHAASSVLVDLTRETDARINERSVEIAIRGRAVRRITVRDSRFGPVISDCTLLRLKQPTALAWVGHAASDELTAMLRVNRAATFTEFREALRGYAVQGYSFTYADETGRVGIVRAAHVPARHARPSDLLEAGSVIDQIVSLADDPRGACASDGVIVSANEDPGTEVTAGLFFAPPDRAARLAELLAASGVARADMEALQRDVASPAALRLRDALARRAAELGVELPPQVLEWDGLYSSESRGALAYELLIGETARRTLPPDQLATFEAVWTGRQLLGTRLLASPDSVLQPALAAAASLCLRKLKAGDQWGQAHRLLVRHPLAGLPIWGKKFGSHLFGVPGSNDTLYKTGHAQLKFDRNRGRHQVSYGASARHIADFADLDDNFVVIPGGQDGWPGSVNASDQLAAWNAGSYCRLPLRPATVRAQFQRVTRLVHAVHST